MSWGTVIVCDKCRMQKSFSVHGGAGDRMSPSSKALDDHKHVAVFVAQHLDHNSPAGLRIIHDYDTPDDCTSVPEDF